MEPGTAARQELASAAPSRWQGPVGLRGGRHHAGHFKATLLFGRQDGQTGPHWGNAGGSFLTPNLGQQHHPRACPYPASIPADGGWYPGKAPVASATFRPGDGQLWPGWKHVGKIGAAFNPLFLQEGRSRWLRDQSATPRQRLLPSPPRIPASASRGATGGHAAGRARQRPECSESSPSVRDSARSAVPAGSGHWF